ISVALAGTKAPSEITVHYSTADGTATSPADYTAKAGDLTFAVGQSSKTISVPVKGDLIREADETFSVNLSNAQGATIDNGIAVGTIIDNDPLPAVYVNDATVTEGNSGTTNAVFTLSLSNPSSQYVTVDYVTGDGTAVAPADYAARSGTKVFLPGQTIKTISIPVKGETAQEANETFFLNLLDADNAAVGDDQGLGTITDDDRPVISINDAPAVTEADGTTTKTMTFTVSLNHAGTASVTVHYATVNGTAMAPGDYTAKSATLTFTAGQVSKTFTVTIKGDNLVEGTETFTVELDTPTNATIGDGTGVGTILDDAGG
ncbi:MAG TPA: Calx-beta domain-containing protein, partial [Actinomycetota bacterium]|nr:Calx-beta domain-containing protein [Actinomycetota bacterium]